MIKKLREINNKVILKYKLANNNEQLLKQRVINKLLQNDNCFFEMTIETAYMILTDLGIEKNNLKNTYLELTKPNK